MNNKIVNAAQAALLDPVGLVPDDLTTIMSGMMRRAIDLGDCYIQSTSHESWVLEDGIIKETHFTIDQGVGIRAVAGEKTGFAFSNAMSIKALKEAAKVAGQIAASAQDRRIKVAGSVEGLQLYKPDNPLSSWPEQNKVDLLRMIDSEIRRLDPRVTHVTVALDGVYEIILLINSLGFLAADIRPLVRFNVNVILESGGRREQGVAGGGGRFTYDEFLVNDRALKLGQAAVHQAQVNFTAVAAPAGKLPVVLGPGWPGVILHEAVGHGLEGDFNRKGSSIFSGMVGQKVASSHCTIVDDGTLSGRRGSLNIDDEGTPSECTVLIENGILKGYIQDTLNARLMNVKPTGNGRRESYAHAPLPRMTNTYMVAGEHTPEEIIHSVKDGIYAANLGGGQVDITSGKFVFSTTEAYRIRNGKIAEPVKNVTLIGSAAEVLNQISMVGNDLAMDDGVGTCGKDGQSVPVGVGQPTLKVDALTVGGTQNS